MAWWKPNKKTAEEALKILGMFDGLQGLDESETDENLLSEKVNVAESVRLDVQGKKIKAVTGSSGATFLIEDKGAES